MAQFLDSLVDKKEVIIAYNLGKYLYHFANLVVRAGPRATSRFMKRYEWLGLRPEREEMSLYLPHRSPGYRAATLHTFTYMGYYMLDLFRRMITEPENILWHEDMVPSEISLAMGLVPFHVEAIPFILPSINVKVAERYIDVAENAGYPPDICSLVKTTIGMVLEDQLPPPRAIVTCNSPCDGGMASYTIYEQKLEVPTFRLDLPYNFTEPRALKYYLREIRQMIEFLEDTYKRKLSCDRLREVCEERNRCLEYCLDIWDLQRSSPAPIGGDVIVYSHLPIPMAAGSVVVTNLMKQLLKIARRTLRRDGWGIPNERHRVILWNAPPLMYPDLFLWMEKEYGAITVMDMLTFNRHPFIDTSSSETMLKDLGHIMAYSPMAKHSRGPYENFFGDLFHAYESFNADMVMVTGHVGCKNTRALFGMFRELCRKRSIPLLIFDYDLSDSRVVSPEGIKKQVADFMENVMGEGKET